MSMSLESIDTAMPLSLPPSDDAVYSLKCFLDINLSDIFVPSHLLCHSQPDLQSTKFHRSEFHSLQKENVFQSIAGFSSYNAVEETDIFESDSDNDLFTSDDVHALAVNCALSNNLSNAQSNDRSLPNACSQNLEISKVPVYLKNDDTLNAKSGGSQNLLVKASKSVVLRTEDDAQMSVCVEQGKSPNINSSNLNSSCAPVQKLDKDFNLLKNLEGSTKVGFGTLKVDNNAMCNGFNVKPAEVNSFRESNNSSSQTSLTEILDTTPDINLKDFPISYKKRDLAEIELENGRERKLREKKQKKKKKTAKYIEFDDSGAQKCGQLFLDDSLADERAHEYFKKIKSRQTCQTSYLPIHSPSEFPDLDKNEADIKFVKSQKSVDPTPMKMNNLAELFSKHYAEEEESSLSDAEGDKEKGTESVQSFKRIAIENIPKNVSKEDIKSVLENFGVLRSFTCTLVGDYQRVIIEVDADSENTDWAIECLNESDPFGNSSTPMKCYSL